MELSELFANDQAAHAAARLAGGVLVIEDAAGNPLASARIGVFGAPSQGAVAAQPFSGVAVATAEPVAFRVFDSAGEELLTGTVGPEQPGIQPPDLVFAPPLIVQYAEVLIDRFVYRVAASGPTPR